MNYRLIVSTAVFSLLLGATSYASIHPVDPGESYRLAFVTSGTTNAINTGNAYYDSIVQTAALNAGLGDDWTAIVSTRVDDTGDGVDARDHTGTNPNDDIGVPIYLLDRTTLIATDNSDLWSGSLLNEINLNENVGATVGKVWTGSNEDGTHDSVLGQLYNVTYGHSGEAGRRWHKMNHRR